jgi:hypothetical protein
MLWRRDRKPRYFSSTFLRRVYHLSISADLCKYLNHQLIAYGLHSLVAHRPLATLRSPVFFSSLVL